MTRRRLTATVLSALAAVGMIGAFAPSASAASCADGKSCIWDGAGNTGAVVQVTYDNASWANFNMTDGNTANNRAGSLAVGDLSSCRVFFYDATNYQTSESGLYYIYFMDESRAGFSADGDLSNGGGYGTAGNWSNKISSNNYVADC